MGIFYAGITSPMNLTPTHIPPWLERLGVPLGLGGLVLGLGWYFFVAGVGTGIELRRGQLEALTREIGQGAGWSSSFRTGRAGTDGWPPGWKA